MSFFKNIGDAHKTSKFDAVLERQQRRIRNKLDETLQSFFAEHQIQLKTKKADILDKFMKKHELMSAYLEATEEVAALLEKKIQGLSLQERNSTIRNLAFDSESPSGLDVKILKALPFMNTRAGILLNQQDNPRQTRIDAIDMQVISDFMHDNCR
jgi:hypothetical protein